MEKTGGLRRRFFVTRPDERWQISAVFVILIRGLLRPAGEGGHRTTIPRDVTVSTFRIGPVSV
ncbi:MULTISPECIES: hypothetical protein [Hyphomicrobiales]|uniref:hypothetical protein n=1 Tax=Hyphomicrobiales TaxID=356 RepID=UPI000F66E67D|nr:MULTISPECIES: hypothetical protein [Hyphomicrobiales]MDH0369851.1 hypothetical protein [Brucella anthropi]RRY17979.1 hypothetical protein EGJ57_16695 [Brucella anthropi]UYT56241.1 hypothetical protein OHI65_19870 [Brucella sp. MAB-22]